MSGEFVVVFEGGENGRREEGVGVRIDSMTGFYIVVAIMLLVVALVYWADAIRSRAKKK